MFRVSGQSVAALAVVFAGVAAAGQVTPLTGSGPGTTLNRDAIAGWRKQQPAASERVVPQFTDGKTWKTIFTAANLEKRPVALSVLFFNQSGTDLYVPIVGKGIARGVQIQLVPGETVSFETPGTAPGRQQGFAIVSQAGRASIRMQATLHQHVDGRPDCETTVPVVSPLPDRFVLPFDNTDFVSTVAIANPNTYPVAAAVNIRDTAGRVIDKQTLTLAPLQHVAFALTAMWKSTAGRQGAIEVLTPGQRLAALGLRFHGATFTSVPVQTSR